MGVFDTQTQQTEAPPENPSDLLTIASQRDDSWQVLARVKTTEEDEQWVVNRFLNWIIKQPRRVSQDAQIKQTDLFWLERLLVSWTLPIPLDPDRTKALGTLTQEDRDYLYNAIMEVQPKEGEHKRRFIRERKPSPALQEALARRRKKAEV